MNKEPNIIINIGGSHSAKSIVAGLIANALEKSGVTNISHLDYDQVTFVEMRKAIEESSENNLKTATIMIVEWDEDEIDNTYVAPEPSIDEESHVEE